MRKQNRRQVSVKGHGLPEHRVRATKEGNCYGKIRRDLTIIQSRFDHSRQLVFAGRDADEQFLACTRAERNGFPTVGGGHGNADDRRSFGVANLADDTWNDSADSRVLAQQALKNWPQTVYDTVLDFELVLFRAETHKWLFKLFLVLEIDPEFTVIVAQRHHGKLPAEGPLEAENLLRCLLQIGDIGDNDIA